MGGFELRPYLWDAGEERRSAHNPLRLTDLFNLYTFDFIELPRFIQSSFETASQWRLLNVSPRIISYVLSAILKQSAVLLVMVLF